MKAITRRVLLGWLAATSGVALAGPPILTPGPQLDAAFSGLGGLESAVFHPGKTLRVMLALQGLGRKGALAAVRAYLQNTPNPPNALFLAVRGLFEPPPNGSLRMPMLGGPTPEPPAKLSVLPLYPLLMLHDVPLSVVRGYVLGGHPEPLGMHLDYLEKNATWRAKPLAPLEARSLRPHLATWTNWSGDPRLRSELEGQVARYEKQPG